MAGKKQTQRNKAAGCLKPSSQAFISTHIAQLHAREGSRAHPWWFRHSRAGDTCGQRRRRERPQRLGRRRNQVARFPAALNWQRHGPASGRLKSRSYTLTTRGRVCCCSAPPHHTDGIRQLCKGREAGRHAQALPIAAALLQKAHCGTRPPGPGLPGDAWRLAEFRIERMRVQGCRGP